MLKAIEVENYRSFAEPARLEVRPITILMGRNSAGKSSLTRLFPLLRQSLTRETSSPILWTSTTIDFGRIGDVINRSAKSDELRLSFVIDTTKMMDGADQRRRGPNIISSGLSEKFVRFNANLAPTVDGKTNYKSFSIDIDEDNLTVVLDGGEFHRLYINDERFDIRKYTESVEIFSSRIFPNVYFQNGVERKYEANPLTSERIVELIGIFVDRPLAEDALRPKKRVSIFADRQANKIAIDRFYSVGELESLFASDPTLKPGSLINKPKLEELSKLSFLTHLPSILSFISDSLIPVFNSSSYLGPIRSSGSRFYREQELSVERIDDKGDNFSTYIGSLNSLELSSFNDILTNAFGVKIRSHQTVGHISIEVAVANSDSYDNLADVGFGFSQLLPLVAQIHSHSRSTYVPFHEQGRQQIIAIEQPELHLHPAFQAQLADLFASAVSVTSASGKNPFFVLESHSETMLARLGELVVQGTISTSDIIVHFIEKDDKDGSSQVRVGEFDMDGIISNWPLGFFSARNI